MTITCLPTTCLTQCCHVVGRHMMVMTPDSCCHVGVTSLNLPLSIILGGIEPCRVSLPLRSSHHHSAGLNPVECLFFNHTLSGTSVTHSVGLNPVESLSLTHLAGLNPVKCLIKDLSALWLLSESPPSSLDRSFASAVSNL